MNYVNRKPDFNNIAKVLRCEVPDRPTLFEFFMNTDLYTELMGEYKGTTRLDHMKYTIDCFVACGYDYATYHGSSLRISTADTESKQTLSLNDYHVIYDRESFDAYDWPDPSKGEYSDLKAIEPYLPGNMKLMIAGPGGVLENVIQLVGYENLCMMLFDDPELVGDIFDKVGSILLKYYSIVATYDSVGIIMSNDDWGFNTQTMLSTEDMRKYVFPWHKKIAAVAHENGKFAVLHSCGNFNEIIEDVIEDMKFDGRHSYEDNIVPVEDAYDRYKGRIAILGGLDVDFLIRSSKEEIYNRAKSMLEKSKNDGGYALGSGNSIPDYIPSEHYFAMTRAVAD